MIRQAISCDVCGAEKRQTNHWFVAYRHGGELRVAGWSASNRLRAGSKHLCGQTCLHKLLDEFIATTMAARPALPSEPTDRNVPVAATDAGLTSAAAHTSIPAAAPNPAPQRRALQLMPPAVVAAVSSSMPALPRLENEPSAPALEDLPNYASRRRRAEAWERERERCSALATHRKS
jgi:hypothetical protein